MNRNGQAFYVLFLLIFFFSVMLMQAAMLRDMKHRAEEKEIEVLAIKGITMATEKMYSSPVNDENSIAVFDSMEQRVRGGVISQLPVNIRNAGPEGCLSVERIAFLENRLEKIGFLECR